MILALFVTLESRNAFDGITVMHLDGIVVMNLDRIAVMNLGGTAAMHLTALPLCVVSYHIL